MARDPRHRRRVLTDLAILAALALLVVAAAPLIVHRSLYAAPPVAVPGAPAPFLEEELTSPDGTRLVAWSYRLPGDRPRPTVLLFHGNAENLETLRRKGTLARLGALGIDFLAVDYPGYGRSGGRASEAALVAAGDAAVAWARHHRPGQPIVACGWSLGAAVAIRTAARHPREVSGLVAICPWTRLAEVAAAQYPRALVAALPLDGYDSLAAAHRIRVPALVVHGLADHVIPPSEGLRLAAALAGPTRVVRLPDGGHEDLARFPRLWAEVGRFFAERAGDPGPGSERVARVATRPAEAGL